MSEAAIPAPAAERRLGAGTLFAMFTRLFALQAVWNYERMQGIGFAHALAPAVRALEPDDASAARALVPQAGYFNTHPVMAAVAVGVVADQLERRARGEAALDDAGLLRVKQALGSSLAAIGDPLFWNAVRPLLALTAVYGWRDARSWFGVFTILAGYNTFAIGYRARGLAEGHRRGLSYVAQLAQRLGPMTAGLRTLAAVVAALVVAAILVPTGGATPVQVLLGAGGIALGVLFFGAARLGPGEWGIALVLLVLAWATFPGARAMKEARLTILNQDGFHARPCSVFVHMASRFKSEIWVRRDDVEVNAKSLLGVMMLAAETGAELIVRAEGPDEDEAIAALTKLAEEKFGTE